MFSNEAGMMTKRQRRLLSLDHWTHRYTADKATAVDRLCARTVMLTSGDREIGKNGRVEKESLMCHKKKPIALRNTPRAKPKILHT